MKFRWIIFDVYRTGEPYGSNDPDEVKKALETGDDFFVVDTENNTWITEDFAPTRAQPLKEFEYYTKEDLKKLQKIQD